MLRSHCRLVEGVIFRCDIWGRMMTMAIYPGLSVARWILVKPEVPAVYLRIPLNIFSMYAVQWGIFVDAGRSVLSDGRCGVFVVVVRTQKYKNLCIQGLVQYTQTSTLCFNLYVLWHLIDQYSFNNNHSCKCHWDPIRACSVYTMLKLLYVKVWRWLSSAETCSLFM
jgi:hypothetical protein